MSFIERFDFLQIFFKGLTRINPAYPAGSFGGIVQKPADDGNVGAFGNVPESGFDGRDILPGPFRHQGENQVIPLFKFHDGAFNKPVGAIPFDRHPAEAPENDGHGKEKPFRLDQEPGIDLCDFNIGQGPDRIHIGGMGKADDHAPVGPVIRQPVIGPSHESVNHPADQTQYRFHGLMVMTAATFFFVLLGLADVKHMKEFQFIFFHEFEILQNGFLLGLENLDIG